MELTIGLPSATESEAPPRADAAPLEPTGPLRALGFYDNQIASDMLAALLQVEGYEVEAVYDGRSALDVARRFRPDVIILDIGLPDIDGDVVERAILDDGSIDRARIIAVSGTAEDAVAGRPQESGFDLLLMEPVDIALLMTSLNSPAGRRWP